MLLPRERKIVGKKSEGGLVFILALIGIMILIAIGYFALTVSTRDLMIASRLAGERKAFSAAEAGAHALSSTYNTDTPASNDKSDTAVDSANDPQAFYNVTGSGEVLGLPGTCRKAMGNGWTCRNYVSTVTGKNNVYQSTVSVTVGIKGKAQCTLPDDSCT